MIQQQMMEQHGGQDGVATMAQAFGA